MFTESTEQRRGTTARRLLQQAAIPIVALLGLAGCTAERPVAKPNAEPVLVLDLAGRPVDPFESTDARVVVFLFTRQDCPISNRHAPEVNRLQQKYSDRDVTFFLVYPNPDATPDGIRGHLEDYAYRSTALRDPEHALVDLTEVTVTPEAVVYVRARGASPRMVYRGRIDNRDADFGVNRRRATQFDLQEALDAAVAGTSKDLVTTKAVGCFLSDMRPDHLRERQ